MSYTTLAFKFSKQFDWTEWSNNIYTKRSSKIIKAMAPGMFVLHHLIEKYQVKDKEETLKLIENGILDKDEFFIQYKKDINFSTESIYYSLYEYLK